MASSFECDGCGHHASFHKMDNPADDAAIKRLQEIQRDQQSQDESTGSRKRPRRAIENGSGNGDRVSQLMAVSRSTDAMRREGQHATGASSTRRMTQQDGGGTSGRVYEILE
jgi:hypothetical protein